MQILWTNWLAGGHGGGQGAQMIWILLLGCLMLGLARAEPLVIRVVAANLTSGNFQTYSPDNANHSNPEGAGARILKALQPDIVLIQEFITTNSPRNRPYDWVLASAAMDRLEVPVKLAGLEFPHGLVFDSRTFEPLEKLAPVQKNDSAAPHMQHMAVVRDFKIQRKSGEASGVK